MCNYVRLFIYLVLLTVFPVQATNWEALLQTETPTPMASEQASMLEAEVKKIPDPIFMDKADAITVKKLLDIVLEEQSNEITLFRTRLSAYRYTKNNDNWLQVESSYLTLASLNKSKQQLIELVDSNVRDRLIGFGPLGVTQFKQEFHLTQLNAQYIVYFQLRSFRELITNFFISPIPIIVAGFKVFLIYLALMWWLRNSTRLVKAFRVNVLDATPNPSIYVRFLWYISRANKAIALLIAISISLRVVAKIQSLQHIALLDIFVLWVLGGSIIISFILEFANRSKRSFNKKIIALRLSTIRRYVWSVIVAGVILQISMITLGKGTIYNWIYNLLYFWFILVTISVIRLWRDYIFQYIDNEQEKPIWVQWSFKQQNTFFLNIVATTLIAVWVLSQRVKFKLVSTLSQYTIFSQVLAYLFRIEVEKQTINDSEQQNLIRITNDDAFNYILPGSEESELIDYASNELKQLSKLLLTDNPALCVLSGERGIGTTTLLKQILYRTKNATTIYLNCPYSGYDEFLKQFHAALGLTEEEVTEAQILAHLRQSEVNYLVAIDNVQRLVKPMVGGLSGLINLSNLFRRSRKDHRVVMAIEKASWRFVDRARGERLLFDMVTFMPKWNEKQICALLDSRINRTLEHSLSFDGLAIPKQWDHEEINEEDRARQGFYRILWHYSDGNPTIALRFFRLSIRRNKETDAVVVRLFNAPESEELDKMPKPMLAILRSIVQLEIASPKELSECTQLTITEVIGTLRYFQSRGFIEWVEDKARLSDHWFRLITNVLDRQHLLVK